MSELAIDSIIKIILGILLIVGIAILLYLFFNGNAFGFFKGLGGSNVSSPSGIFLSLLK